MFLIVCPQRSIAPSQNIPSGNNVVGTGVHGGGLRMLVFVDLALWYQQMSHRSICQYLQINQLVITISGKIINKTNLIAIQVIWMNMCLFS